MLILVPIAFVLEFITHGPEIAIFAVSALALIPLAAVLGKATEELAVHTGPRVGGLLNATLGNAAELIITIVALRAGLTTLVKASLVGSILGNILIVLGLSLLLGGLKNGVQRFNREEAGVVGALLMLSVIAMAVPTVLAATIAREAGQSQVVALSDEVAFVMILMYLAYLAYSFLGTSNKQTAVAAAPGGAGQQVPANAPGGNLHGATTPAGAVQSDGGTARQAGTTTTVRPTDSGHGGTGHGAPAQGHAGGHGGGHEPTWSVGKSIGALLVSTLFIVAMSEFLVGAIGGITESLGLSELFLGVMIIPVVGNVAEHIVGVQVAYKNQMDLSLAISLGSSLQIALFVAPVLLFISLFVGPNPMDLVFTSFEIIALLATVSVGVIVSLDGESNWLEGVLLLGLYFILGIAFFNIPG